MLSWIRSAPSAAINLTPERELEELEDALAVTTLIMEDKFDEMEEALSQKTSPFHRYMRSLGLFMRAVLGVEPETIKKGLTVIAEAEQTAQEYLTHTQRNPKSTHQGDQYPPGTVYALMHAELQFLSAVFAIMNGNLSDALKALLRVRKGYNTLHQLYQCKEQASTKFQSADELTRRRSFDFTFAGDQDAPTAHPIDKFVHTGLCHCYGILVWALSIVPAPWDKFLAFMSYTGDRKLGHSLMWEASKYPETIHGAIASYTTLVIYNGLSARCNIRMPDAVPYEKVEQLLVALEKHYPASHKWAVKRNLMLAVHDRNIIKARDVLQPGIDDKTALKFITALCLFEQGCKNLYLQDYYATAHCFTEIAKYTDWSYSLFNWVVGIAYVDAYRHAKKSGASESAELALKATQSLEKVMNGLCSRKVLGKPMPIEVYIRSNMTRYFAKAAAQNCALVDAVDVSPAQELVWLYGGYDCQTEEQLLASMDTIELYETTVTEEVARKSLLTAACLRARGRLEDSGKLLKDNVVCHTAADIRSWDKNAANWLLPAAHFDVAECYWFQAHPEMKDPEKLQACAEHIRIASRWGSSDFQSIMGIKLSTATEALKKLGLQV